MKQFVNGILIILILPLIVTIIEFVMYLLNIAFIKIINKVIISSSIKVKIINTNKRLCKFVERLDIYNKVSILQELFLTLILCFYSVKAVYYLIYMIIIIVLNRYSLDANIYGYLTLTIMLLLISYFPERIIFSFQRGTNYILRKLFRKSKLVLEETKKLIFYQRIAIFLRPKLWVYFISIFITILSSIEKILGMKVLDFEFWNSVRSAVIESVLTMIVVDRFVNLLKNEFGSIKKDIKEIRNK